jgi:GNAT superfamily N-acetyltransferase
MTARIVTAETDEGRRAIEEVMAHSYQTDIEGVPLEWARALVVDGVPVSFMRVNPDDAIALPGGKLRAAFLDDMATREDRRREGHFRTIMERMLADLRAAGISCVTTHGPSALYRRFGFHVCTHHCGLFITPAEIEQRAPRLRGRAAEGGAGEELLEVDDHPQFVPDLLVVSEVRAWTFAEARAALLRAAALARQRGKTRILFEHPRADHRLHPSLETPFSELARACGAQMIVTSADPEGRRVDHADWYKVLDTHGFLADAVPLRPVKQSALPEASVTFETDAGTATIRGAAEGATVIPGACEGAWRLAWPTSAVAQLALGHTSAAALVEMHGIPLPLEPLAMLDALFPRWWRLSRNEEWVFTA